MLHMKCVYKLTNTIMYSNEIYLSVMEETLYMLNVEKTVWIIVVVFHFVVE